MRWGGVGWGGMGWVGVGWVWDGCECGVGVGGVGWGWVRLGEVRTRKRLKFLGLLLRQN